MPHLITDFDGTVTRRDFFELALDELLPPESMQFWRDYEAGRITHFDALAGMFRLIRCSEAVIADVARRTEPEPRLAEWLGRLAARGWRTAVASAGCAWYIRRLLDDAGVAVAGDVGDPGQGAPAVGLHANPGTFDPARGLLMTRPTGSPFASHDLGIDKAAVVRDAIARGGVVAFAGDGRPDLAAALLVPAERRFARGRLAELLAARGEGFRPFERWAEVAAAVEAMPV